MSRRAVFRTVAAGMVVVGVVGAAVWTASARPSSGGTDDRGTSKSTATAEVTRRTLVEQEKVEGTLGYGKTQVVTAQLQGTITKLPAEGSVVERGQSLYELDGGRQVTLMYGERPAWRTLGRGAKGPDVRQLEENLVAMGFATTDTLTVDDEFTGQTAAAVRRWQKAMGVEQDGVVELGEVVFLPGPVRVSAHKSPAGSQSHPGATIVEVSGTARVVTVDLDARRQSLVQVGTQVEVELPDGKRIPGTVSEIGKVAQVKSQGGKATVEVVITLGQGAGGDLDKAPVTVRITRQARERVLTVPVNALLALPEGGYAVEVDEHGSRRMVPVTTGVFSQGHVEVSGEGVTEGTKVVVPR